MTPLWTKRRAAYSSPDTRWAADRGAASLWLLAAGLVLAAAGIAGAGLGAAYVAHHRAQAAADLGALAGAMRVADGANTACAAATEIVTSNAAQLTSCRLDGLDVVVTARVALTGFGAPGLSASATARAGPARAAARPAGCWPEPCLRKRGHTIARQRTSARPAGSAPQLVPAADQAARNSRHGVPSGTYAQGARRARRMRDG